MSQGLHARHEIWNRRSARILHVLHATEMKVKKAALIKGAQLEWA